MLRKLVRAVFTIAGAVLGYGAFLLVKFLARFFGHDDWVNFTNMQEFYISVSFALIFGLIFFQLTPTIKKQGNKMADNIESDLKKVSTNDIVMGTVGRRIDHRISDQSDLCGDQDPVSECYP